MSRRKVLLLSALVLAIVTAGWFLPLRTWMLGLAETIRDAGALGVLLFFVVYILSTVVLLPGSLLTLMAGFAYGPAKGLLVAAPAALAAATVAFLLGRSVLRDWVRRTVSRSPRARALDRALGRQGFKLVLLLRLSPLVPFNLLNYALSLSDISLGRYVAGSAVGMLPGAFLYVYLGSLVTTAAELTTAPEGADGVRLAVWGLGLSATVAVMLLITRTARRALAAELPSLDRPDAAGS